MTQPLHGPGAGNPAEGGAVDPSAGASADAPTWSGARLHAASKASGTRANRLRDMGLPHHPPAGMMKRHG